MNRAQVANWILSSVAALDPPGPISPPPTDGAAREGGHATDQTPSASVPFGRRSGPPYESVPLIEAQELLRSLNETSQEALLIQAHPYPKVV